MPHTGHTQQPDDQPRFQCRHIFTDGRRCASPSLRQEYFCYYHHTTRKPVPKEELARRRGHQAQFFIATPEDRSAIQISIGEVLQRIASNDIDPRRAGLLLYGLQIASSNLPRPTAPIEADTVEDLILDPEYGPLAPPATYEDAFEDTIEHRMLRETEAWAAEVHHPESLPTARVPHS